MAGAYQVSITYGPCWWSKGSWHRDKDVSRQDEDVTSLRQTLAEVHDKLVERDVLEELQVCVTERHLKLTGNDHVPTELLVLAHGEISRLRDRVDYLEDRLDSDAFERDFRD